MKKLVQAHLKIYLQNVFKNHISNIYIYIKDLALNDQWLLIHHKTNQVETI